MVEAAVIVLCGVAVKIVYIDGVLGGDNPVFPHVGVAIAGGILNLLIMKQLGHYDQHAFTSNPPRGVQIFRALMLSFFILIFIGFLLKIAGVYSRGWLLAWFILSLLSLIAVRKLAAGLIARFSRQGLFNERVAIVGAEPLYSRVRQHFVSGQVEADLAGQFCVDCEPVCDLFETVLTRKLRELVAFHRQHPLDRVIVALPSYTKERIQEILLELGQMSAHIDCCPSAGSLSFKRPGISYLGDIGLYNLQRHPISWWGLVTKRLLDLALTIPALLILGFPMLIIAAIIRLTSPGKALFVQERHGLNDSVIRVLKFRTMTDKVRDGTHQARKGDAEITAVGSILRKTSLDELPQLINVLRGDMSLVGPRPHTLMLNQKFADVVQLNKEIERFERYATRHKVKPGMTGWAQVHGCRGETDTRDKMEKRVGYDLQYINEWSIWLDLKIILMTIVVVMKGENAH
jgi:polysaccharide biosynthesis protein PslA